MKPFTAAAVAILLANSATAAEPGTAAPFSPPVQEGVDHGFKDCAATVDKAIKRLREGDGGDGAPHYVDHWNPEGADGSLFNIVVIAAQGEGDVVSTVTAVRNASGSCDVMQTLVFPVPATCPEVRTDVFSHWTHAVNYTGKLTHYSILKATEDLLGLPELGLAATAPNLRTAFGL